MPAMPRPPARLAACLALLIPLAACQAPQPAACGRGQPSLSAQLYFGRDRDGEEAPKPGGNTPIPDAEWRQFLEDVVTPRFPDGFTVIDSYGQWRNPQTGIVTHQRSAVLTIVAADTPQTLAKLDEISDAWKRKTHHLSVGLALTPVCAAF
jgi:hypothetical protein